MPLLDPATLQAATPHGLLAAYGARNYQGVDVCERSLGLQSFAGERTLQTHTLQTAAANLG